MRFDDPRLSKTQCPILRARATPSGYRITNHDGQTFEFEKYYLRPATYEAAARDAGFPDFRWVDARLARSEQGDSYWDDFMAQAPVTAFTASKRQGA